VERIAARRLAQAIKVVADKATGAKNFVNELRSNKASPHVAQNTNGRSSAIYGRDTPDMPSARD
jgi:hypothetical protein